VAFELDRIYLGDCRELMREIPDQSVDLVLTDPTAVACINTGRRFIGFELFPECYDMAVARIRDAQEQARLFPFPEEGSA